ncbi:DUF3638 family protein [Pelomyxa schiedti]|nr:DUF3638 family protein [Pelomyxa schiedti]
MRTADVSDVLSEVGSKWQSELRTATGTTAIRLQQMALDALQKDSPDAAHVALRACCTMYRKSGGATAAAKLLGEINAATVEKYTKHLFSIVANSTAPHVREGDFTMPSQGLVLGVFLTFLSEVLPDVARSQRCPVDFTVVPGWEPALRSACAAMEQWAHALLAVDQVALMKGQNQGAGIDRLADIAAGSVSAITGSTNGMLILPCGVAARFQEWSYSESHMEMGHGFFPSAAIVMPQRNSNHRGTGLHWVQISGSTSLSSRYHQGVATPTKCQMITSLDICEVPPANVSFELLRMLFSLNIHFFTPKELYKVVLAKLNGLTEYKGEKPETAKTHRWATFAQSWCVVKSVLFWILVTLLGGEKGRTLYKQALLCYELFLLDHLRTVNERQHCGVDSKVGFLLSELCHKIAHNSCSSFCHCIHGNVIPDLQRTQEVLERFRTANLDVEQSSRFISLHPLNSFALPPVPRDLQGGHLIHSQAVASSVSNMMEPSLNPFSLSPRQSCVQHLWAFDEFAKREMGVYHINAVYHVAYEIEAVVVNVCSQKRGLASWYDGDGTSEDIDRTAELLCRIGGLYYSLCWQVAAQTESGSQCEPTYYARYVTISFAICAMLDVLARKHKGTAAAMKNVVVATSLGENPGLLNLWRRFIVVDMGISKLLQQVVQYFEPNGRKLLFESPYNGTEFRFDETDETVECAKAIAREVNTYERMEYDFCKLSPEESEQKWSRLVLEDNYMPKVFCSLRNIAYLTKLCLAGFPLERMARLQKRLSVEQKTSTKKFQVPSCKLKIDGYWCYMDDGNDFWFSKSYAKGCATACSISLPKGKEQYQRLLSHKDATGNGAYSENEIIVTQELAPQELSRAQYFSLGFIRSDPHLTLNRLFIALKTRELMLECEEHCCIVKQCLFEVVGFCNPSQGSSDQEPYLAHRLKYVVFATAFVDLFLEQGRTLLTRIEQYRTMGNVLDMLIGIHTFCSPPLVQHIAICLAELRRALQEWLAANTERIKQGNLNHERNMLSTMQAYLILTFSCTTPPSTINASEWKSIVSARIDIEENAGLAVFLPAHLYQKVMALFFQWHEQLCSAMRENSGNQVIIPPGPCTGRAWECSSTTFGCCVYTRAPYTVDLLQGKVYKNNLSVGGLPSNICRHPDYITCFGDNVFLAERAIRLVGSTEVVCFESRDTKSSRFHNRITPRGDGSQNLWIEERPVGMGETSFLTFVPRCRLEGWIPKVLVESYTHWFSPTNNEIIVRGPHHSLKEEASRTLAFTINLTTRCIFSNTHGKFVVPFERACEVPENRALCDVLKGFEDPHYILVLANSISSGTVLSEIHLPRMNLSFQVRDGRIFSDDFKGSALAKCQLVATLHGLTQYLVLEDGASAITQARRKIIIPHREIQNKRHGLWAQDVELNSTTLFEPPYFTFDVDETLRCLRPETTAGSLFLAHLYNKTSHGTDHLTQMSGFDTCAGLLQSCWQNSPFSEVEMSIIYRFLELNNDGCLPGTCYGRPSEYGWFPNLRAEKSRNEVANLLKVLFLVTESLSTQSLFSDPKKASHLKDCEKRKNQVFQNSFAAYFLFYLSVRERVNQRCRLSVCEEITLLNEIKELAVVCQKEWLMQYQNYLLSAVGTTFNFTCTHYLSDYKQIEEYCFTDVIHLSLFDYESIDHSVNQIIPTVQFQRLMQAFGFPPEESCGTKCFHTRFPFLSFIPLFLLGRCTQNADRFEHVLSCLFQNGMFRHRSLLYVLYVVSKNQEKFRDIPVPSFLLTSAATLIDVPFCLSPEYLTLSLGDLQKEGTLTVEKGYIWQKLQGFAIDGKGCTTIDPVTLATAGFLQKLSDHLRLPSNLRTVNTKIQELLELLVSRARNNAARAFFDSLMARANQVGKMEPRRAPVRKVVMREQITTKVTKQNVTNVDPPMAAEPAELAHAHAGVWEAGQNLLATFNAKASEFVTVRERLPERKEFPLGIEKLPTDCELARALGDKFGRSFLTRLENSYRQSLELAIGGKTLAFRDCEKMYGDEFYNKVFGVSEEALKQFLLADSTTKTEDVEEEWKLLLKKGCPPEAMPGDAVSRFKDYMEAKRDFMQQATRELKNAHLEAPAEKLRKMDKALKRLQPAQRSALKTKMKQVTKKKEKFEDAMGSLSSSVTIAEGYIKHCIEQRSFGPLLLKRMSDHFSCELHIATQREQSGKLELEQSLKPENSARKAYLKRVNGTGQLFPLECCGEAKERQTPGGCCYLNTPEREYRLREGKTLEMLKAFLQGMLKETRSAVIAKWDEIVRLLFGIPTSTTATATATTKTTTKATTETTTTTTTTPSTVRPNNSERTALWQLRLLSGELARPTTTDILRLTLDPSKLAEFNPLLEGQQRNVADRIHTFLCGETLSMQISRVLVLISQHESLPVGSSDERSQLFQDIGRELLAQRCFAPSEHPSWLLFELENNILIREVQCNLLLEMEKDAENCMYQLNMGEGKTSVILVLLCQMLATGSQKLVRVNVLEPLMGMMKTVLSSRFGQLLRRRIYTLPFTRSVNISKSNLEKILETLEECRRQRHVLLVTPEHRMCLQLKSQEVLLQYLDYQNARDVFDWNEFLERTYDGGVSDTEVERRSRWDVIRGALVSLGYLSPTDGVIIKFPSPTPEGEAELQNALNKATATSCGAGGSGAPCFLDSSVFLGAMRMKQTLVDLECIDMNDKIKDVPGPGQEERKTFIRKVAKKQNALFGKTFQGGSVVWEILLKNSVGQKALMEEQLRLFEKIRNVACCDLLDESDEILRCSSELNYTLGSSKQFDGGEFRWKVPACLLRLLFFDPSLREVLQKGVPMKAIVWFNGWLPKTRQGGGVPSVRFTSEDFFNSELRTRLASLAIAKITAETKCMAPVDPTTPITLGHAFTYLQLVLGEVEPPILEGKIVESLMERDPQLQQVLLVLKGWLTHGILYHVMSYRYRVEYGLDCEEGGMPQKLMAVPFRGKDTPALRAEFSHPDILIGFTILSYLYQGLHEEQMKEALMKLKKHATQYGNKWLEGWVRSETTKTWIEESIGTGASFPEWLISFSTLELESHSHLATATRALGRNFDMVGYYLETCVFPEKAKHYATKITGNGHTLASEGQTKGFSGTDDRRDTMPEAVVSKRLPSQEGTDGKMLHILTRTGNRSFRKVEFERSSQFLDLVLEYCKETPNCFILCDSGALITGMDNSQVAEHLLRGLPDPFRGVVYVDECTGSLMVLHRNLAKLPLASCHLSKSELFSYLDDVHTRGTDLKLPLTARGIVTLGRSMSKDKLMQTVMRLRQLDSKQSVTTWGTPEVANEIATLNCLGDESQINSEHVLRWVTLNTTRRISGDLFSVVVAKFRHVVKMRAQSYQRLNLETPIPVLIKALVDPMRAQSYQRLNLETPIPVLIKALVDPVPDQLDALYGLTPTVRRPEDALTQKMSVLIEAWSIALRKELRELGKVIPAKQGIRLTGSDCNTSGTVVGSIQGWEHTMERDIQEDRRTMTLLLEKVKPFLLDYAQLDVSFGVEVEKEKEMEELQVAENALAEGRNTVPLVGWDYGCIFAGDFVAAARRYQPHLPRLHSLGDCFLDVGNVPNLTKLRWSKRVLATDGFIQTVNVDRAKRIYQNEFLRPADMRAQSYQRLNLETPIPVLIKALVDPVPDQLDALYGLTPIEWKTEDILRQKMYGLGEGWSLGLRRGLRELDKILPPERRINLAEVGSEMSAPVAHTQIRERIMEGDEISDRNTLNSILEKVKPLLPHFSQLYVCTDPEAETELEELQVAENPPADSRCSVTPRGWDFQCVVRSDFVSMARIQHTEGHFPRLHSLGDCFLDVGNVPNLTKLRWSKRVLATDGFIQTVNVDRAKRIYQNEFLRPADVILVHKKAPNEGDHVLILVSGAEANELVEILAARAPDPAVFIVHLGDTGPEKSTMVPSHPHPELLLASPAERQALTLIKLFNGTCCYDESEIPTIKAAIALVDSSSFEGPAVSRDRSQLIYEHLVKMQLLQRGFFTNILVAKLKKNQILLTGDLEPHNAHCTGTLVKIAEGSLVEFTDMIVLSDVTNTLKKLVAIRGRLAEFEGSDLQHLL